MAPPHAAAKGIVLLAPAVSMALTSSPAAPNATASLQKLALVKVLLLHTGVGQQLIQVGHLSSPSPTLTEKEERALLRSRKRDEECRESLGIPWRVTPPRVVIESNESNRVVLEPFALVHCQERNLVSTLELVQAGRPAIACGGT